jgi:hypothetical protein
LTAYKDRAETAEALAGILLALVQKEISNAAPAEWFTPQGIENGAGVTFPSDLAGNWDGTWITPEDELNQNLLEEDMGISFEIEDMDLLEEGTGMLATTDETSINSFGTAFGRDATPKEPQESAAAGSSETEGTGMTGALAV